MADGETYASETLFSFEVLVEYIRIHKPGLVKRGFEPAVGVRLLDFPTLLIYRGEQDDSRHQEDSDSEKENTATHISKHDASLQQHMNRSMEYRFRKGKSCLFKINLDLFHTHLSNVPLYVMVLDSRNEIPKLMGSSMVSLAKIIDVIKTDVKQLGICTPSAQGEKGLFGIYNLMGEKIGCISLGYKLLSLGASLIPHIPESRVLHFGSGKTPVKQPLKPSDSVPETKTYRGEGILQPDSSNVLYQNIELDGQQTDVVVSETEAKRAPAVSMGTQTEPARRQVKRIEVEQIDFDREGNLNVYCPPPLYYSCSEGRREEADADRYRPVDVAMEALRVEDLHAEDEELDLPAERRSVGPSGEARRSRATEQSQAPPALLGEALRRLPLLSALLQELSQLNGQAQELPFPAPAGLAWQRQPVPHTPTPQPRSSCASPTSRGSRSPSPRLKRSQVNSAAPPLAPPKHLGKAQRQSLRPGKEAPKSPPKRKLVHRLTKTVRLRLQQHNPDVLREQERREQLWGSRASILKQASGRRHRPSTAKSGQKLTSSPRGQALDWTANLDENVQTLVSSVDLDSTRTGTPPLQPRACKRGGGRRTGQSENGSAVHFSPPYDHVSRPAAEGSPGLGQNRTVQVRIPSALSQYSDRSDGGGAPSDTSDPWLPLNNPGFRSPAALRSDSCRGSPDPGEYLDDFTSPEPTEGFSPDLPGSPEPASGRVSKQASGINSASQERRRLQASDSDSASQEHRRPQASDSDSASQERRRPQTLDSDSASQERRRPQASDSDSASQERRRPQASDSDSASQERRRPQASDSDTASQERRRPQASDSDSASQASGRPALTFPVKSRGSPQRSLKGTHIIRPRTRASAISISSGDSERVSALARSGPARHRGSGAAGGAAGGPSVSQESGGSGVQLSERFENSPSPQACPADSRLLSNDSELDSVVSPPPENEGETRDELGSLGFSNKCHHISELVLSKLPGYTL
ncbi:microtubule-associated protein 10 [Anguilla rostrata]|uniref:microtubule-associated protein 10 n=1 Tax=Anguilla rostrata TaxID=7938 RepID=UPI0030CAEBCF